MNTKTLSPTHFPAHRRRFAPRAALALVAGTALALAVPLVASAHVTVSPDTAPAGSFVVLNFKVPNESDTAQTTKVEVDLPTDHPFLSVYYVPVPGWTTQLVTKTLDKPVKSGDDTITESATKVIWTADAGSALSAGQLQQFGLSVGPVPDSGSETFLATQYYSDGTIEHWTQKGASAEHPAPVLYINDPVPGANGEQSASTASPTVAAPAAEPADDVLARVLGILGLVVGAVGVVIAILGRRRESE